MSKLIQIQGKEKERKLAIIDDLRVSERVHGYVQWLCLIPQERYGIFICHTSVSVSCLSGHRKAMDSHFGT